MIDDLFSPFRNRPFQSGWNPILENDPETQLDFGIFLLEPDQKHTFESDTHEMAILILKGRGDIRTNDRRVAFDRVSWIEQSPWAVHSSPHTAATVRSTSQTEIAVIQTPNTHGFPQRIFTPEEVENEHRGKGILDDTSYRIVRCLFDRRNAPPESNLVLGEVVNFPGRWSSYPPHHHAQPEIYYYRFEPDWGYGHGELGDDVYKIKQHDLLRITGRRDHSQTAAPGFSMYYLWAIRHLPGDPYTGFEFSSPFEKLLG